MGQSVGWDCANELTIGQSSGTEQMSDMGQGVGHERMGAMKNGASRAVLADLCEELDGVAAQVGHAEPLQVHNLDCTAGTACMACTAHDAEAEHGAQHARALGAMATARLPTSIHVCAPTARLLYPVPALKAINRASRWRKAVRLD